MTRRDGCDGGKRRAAGGVGKVGNDACSWDYKHDYPLCPDLDQLTWRVSRLKTDVRPEVSQRTSHCPSSDAAMQDIHAQVSSDD